MRVRYSKQVGIKWCVIFAAVLLMWMIAGQADVSAAQVQAGSWRQSGVCQIGGGFDHVVALKSDGTVVVWGSNREGQLNVPAEAQSNVVAVAAGEFHSLALKSNGTVVAWGNNDEEQLNVPVEAQSGVVAIAAGAYHSLALKSNGSVVAWGGNSDGETIVPVEAQSGIVAIAASRYNSLALTSDGCVVAWGDNNFNQTSVIMQAQSGVVDISASGLCSMALKSDGCVVAWGDNRYGQLDIPLEAQSGVVDISAKGGVLLALKSDGSLVAWGSSNSFGQLNVPVEAQSGVVAIEAGPGYILALKSDGTVVGWGKDEYGQTSIPGGLSMPVRGKAVSGGGVHSLALRSDGTLAAWGNNNDSQSTIPENLNDVTSIAGGGAHSLALKSNGLVVAWGKDDKGQSTVPGYLNDVVAISAGVEHSLALRSDGTVVAWGSYDDYQCIPPPGMRGIKAIAAGGYHNLILRIDGRVLAWGRHSSGQTTLPLGLSGVVAISAGAEHSLALKSDGTVVAWGNDNQGRSTVPNNLDDVVAIAAGAEHSLALKADGTVVAWGSNESDQCRVPADLNGVVAITAGDEYSMALKSDGTIAAWGSGQAKVPSSGDLSGLTIDLGDLSPSPFDPSVTEYTFRYAGASVTSVNISGTLDNPDETELYIYGQERESEAVVTVPLNETSTDIIVGVKSCFLPEKIYTVTVYRDMNAPTVAFGTNGSETYTDVTATTVTVSDEVSGVDASSFEYAWATGVDIPESGWISFSSGDTLTKSGADGNWYLHIKAADTAGNIVNAVSNRFRLDSATPAASMVSPTGTSAAISTSNIVLGFSESVTGVEGGEITISDGSNTYTCTLGESGDYINEIESEYRAIIPVSSFIYNGEPLVLAYDTTYTVTVEAGAYIDVAGKETAAGDIGSFTTETVPTSTVTVSVNPIAGGLVSGSGTYCEGNSVTVTATTSSGYVFVSWTEDGAEVSTSASYTFTMGTSDRDLVANFSALPATLESIAITTLPAKLIYTVGDSLDISGMVVTGTYSDSSTRGETVTTADVSGFDSTTPAAIQVLTVTVGSKTDTYTVTINPIPDTAVNLAAISGVTVPANGAVPLTIIAESAQYTGTVVWSPADNPFVPGTVYTATITLTPKAGYTLDGVEENFFTVAGAESVSNSADSGIVTAIFPETAAPSNASIFPAIVIFDLDNPSDVMTAITWNSADYVTNVIYSVSPDTTLNMLDTGDYTVADDTLTISNSFFLGLLITTGDAIDFELTFNTGVASTLTVYAVNGYTPSSNADLSSLSVNGSPVSCFDTDNAEYNVELPYGVTSATVTATAGDLNAQVSITQASSLPGSATVTVTAEDGTTTRIYTVNFTIAELITTYTVTFNSNGNVYDTKTVNAGQSIGNVAWPDNPTRNSYTFRGWYTGENGTGIQFTSDTPLNATMNVYAKWTYSGGDRSSSGGRSTTPVTPTYNAEVTLANGSSLLLPVTVDKRSINASVDVGSGNSFMSEGEKTIITLPDIPDVDTYTLNIPVLSLSTQDEQSNLSFKTDKGTVTVSSNMLTGVMDISGKKTAISIGQGDKTSLPSDVKATIGDKPLISLSLSIDGKHIDWSNPDAPVTVSIPYTPTAAELQNPESIVIWYIDGRGNVVSVLSGHYDLATGMVTFDTTHFSLYAVSYNKVNFIDVADTAWYSDAVGFIAARGITAGTGNGKYSPDARLTRSEFIVMMMRSYSIAPDESPTENFSDAGSTYYTGYLATAKRLGISAGVGNNLFAPGKEITRQEMFTLLYNALKVIRRLPQGTEEKSLSDFSDASDIASWAKDAVTLMVETGTIGGSAERLNPESTASRAEMAQVLYKLLAK